MPGQNVYFWIFPFIAQPSKKLHITILIYYIILILYYSYILYIKNSRILFFRVSLSFASLYFSIFFKRSGQISPKQRLTFILGWWYRPCRRSGFHWFVLRIFDQIICSENNMSTTIRIDFQINHFLSPCWLSGWLSQKDLSSRDSLLSNILKTELFFVRRPGRYRYRL